MKNLIAGIALGLSVVALSGVIAGIGLAADGRKGVVASSPDKDHGHSDEKEHDHPGGEDAHAHTHDESEKNEDGHGEKGHQGHVHDENEAEHGHGAEAGGHEEEGSRVGPGKGIVAAHEDLGIQLSPEAMKNFEVKFQILEGQGPWTLPAESQLLSGEERNLYRSREGYLKRIDFTLVRGTSERIMVRSKDLRPGDSIVIRGVGFLRIAELTAFGGAPEGHSH